jgi:Glycosyltransferase family 87
LRENALVSVTAAAGVAAMAWLGLVGFAWTDYDNEVAPAYLALTHGHVLRFLQLAPAYGGSLVLRAPFALAPGLWGGGELAVYRMVALPCLLAGAALGVWLVAGMRSEGRSRLARGVALGVCVVNPVTLRALELGHPEELLGAVLCVTAVLLAMRDRPQWAGLALGLAIANKPWALLAVGPVLLALSGQRMRALLVAGTVTAVVLAPLLAFVGGGLGGTSAAVATHTGAIFQPWQAWWFFGHHGHAVYGLFGNLKPGYRTPPGWLEGIPHPLIVALGLPLTLLCVRRRRRGLARGSGDALLLLTLLLLLRSVLDPWSTGYYLLPFLLALLVWETHERTEPPLFALAGSAATWAVFEWVPGSGASADVQSLAFMVLATPALVALALSLYRPRVLRGWRLEHKLAPSAA